MVSLKPVKITRVRNFSQYQKFVTAQKFSQTVTLAKKLTGVKITVISATPYGGGVAEIWHSLVPIFHSLGLDLCWYTIAAPNQFFEITKKFHNLLQGQTGKLTPAEQKLYLSVNKKLAKDLSQIPTDILLIHDPQPAAIIQFLIKKPTSIWRCHIDTSTINRTAWEFLKLSLRSYNHLIFTLPQYVHDGISENHINSPTAKDFKKNQLKENISFFQPTIDPFDEKLTRLTKFKAWKILSQFGLKRDKPLIFVPCRFDPWKDLFGTLEAFLIVKRHEKTAQILFTGPLALDDPEAVRVQRKLLRKIKKTQEVQLGKDVFVYSNQDQFSYQQLAAAYCAASVVIQKSLAEGFGLTVAEAAYFKKPVIGSQVGGIAYQIIDYSQDPKKATGVLIDVTGKDRGIADCAFWIEFLLKDKNLAKILAARAKAQAMKNFLHPKTIFNYLNLFTNLLVKKGAQKISKIQIVTHAS